MMLLRLEQSHMPVSRSDSDTLQLKSTLIGNIFTGASWHADRGAFAVFVWQSVIIEGSQ